MCCDGFGLWPGLDQSVRECDERSAFRWAEYQKVLDSLFEGMQRNNTRQMLVVGVDMGDFSEKMTGLGASVTEIDCSSKTLDMPKRKTPGVQVLPADIRNGLPDALTGRSFDGIACAFALRHFPNEQKDNLIRSLFGMLSPGGLLLMGAISFQNQEEGAACARLNQEAPDSNAFCFAYDKIKGSIGIPYERTQVSSHAEILSVRKPKMLLFGYGGTLFHEAPYHYERGFQALLANVESNPGNHTPKGISAFFEQMQKTVFDIQRKNHADVSQTVLLRALFERLGIHFLLTPLEMESVFYENAYQGRPTEGVGSLLDLLSEKGIRTGIVCNQSYSGQALSIHLRSVFPKHRFEMIVTSGDYLFQKPSPVLFEIAIQKANLSAAEIWFCGDDFAVDIKGAEMSGLFPVWYAGDAAGQIAPGRLTISCWDELAQLFKEPELSF